MKTDPDSVYRYLSLLNLSCFLRDHTISITQLLPRNSIHFCLSSYVCELFLHTVSELDAALE